MKKILLVGLISALSLTSSIYYKDILEYLSPSTIQLVSKLAEEELLKMETEETNKVQQAIEKETTLRNKYEISKIDRSSPSINLSSMCFNFGC